MHAAEAVFKVEQTGVVEAEQRAQLTAIRGLLHELEPVDESLMLKALQQKTY